MIWLDYPSGMRIENSLTITQNKSNDLSERSFFKPNKSVIDKCAIIVFCHFRILCAEFDNKLLWKHHVDMVLTCLGSIFGMIYKCHYILNYKWLMTSYITLYIYFIQE